MGAAMIVTLIFELNKAEYVRLGIELKKYGGMLTPTRFHPYATTTGHENPDEKQEYQSPVDESVPRQLPAWALNLLKK
jgi:hypothetical protein